MACKIVTENAGMTKCLGLDCDAVFWSPDKINTRFCKKCRGRQYRSEREFNFRLPRPRRIRRVSLAN